MIIKLRRPYPAEDMKNYIAYDFETGIAEIVLHNKALLPRCFKILIKRFIRKNNERERPYCRISSVE